jgi:hypothetical protein
VPGEGLPGSKTWAVDFLIQAVEREKEAWAGQDPEDVPARGGKRTRG